MPLRRRDFLAAATIAAALPELDGYRRAAGAEIVDGDWETIRAQFRLDPTYVNMVGLLLTSHPEPVHNAIREYRTALDENPALYAMENRWDLERRARRAAARFIGARYQEVALTDSTTMGLSQIYNGIRVRSDQELFTTEEDYYATQQALRYTSRRTGASLRIVPMPSAEASAVSAERIVDRLVTEVRPETRVLGLTWVHSKTGLKLPVRKIADELAVINRGRDETDRVLLVLDGVHGFGVEDFQVSDLGCDFFAAGAHKWLFGPRGTGIIWGRPERTAEVDITIPTFTPDGTWGGHMTPGGFKPFEHQWALPAAFRFQENIGRDAIAARIHELNRQMREGLSTIPQVRLHTPMKADLASGITCFDIEGMRPEQVVEALLERNFVASETPYKPSSARVTPGLFNTPEEVDRTLAAIGAIAKRA
ncbi:aminotransferase class V-fold PLP-dependent enzyme [Thiohalomonas denitrificans]|uniref:aminotransferase class V-fold PLP-dependent enzyme n=1 Tax=Thiohalomonas denitrificans TaxID=415747 RepID=UPI0026EBDDB9|nr:aminotransferase class V-fold PLP-dependent enzyme [Thiohalomonas denitrificans]